MDNKEIELQALITEREAMVAENIYRSALSQGPAYADADFGKVAAEIRALKSVDLSATVPAVAAANNARLEIAEKLLKQWYRYWNHTADLTTVEAVDLQNATYSFINSSATSAVA